ncbi:aldo/keto reductase [Roseitranquillus sediminis]|uniref:aldo/keto reductase n=1 Tax=Roseitranquillus sediminis TaxID=2809051 RepID=UPI001D0C8C77|nr:aldo/keto reductase [Roseitranquillus sediminis]MBM9593098.1 aldo/keto reductase [Roseitranquillus sediminis]
MRKTRLGRTCIEVSEICLGSMTWGSQNTEAEGHAQLDRAIEVGVNFIDTAEMYPTNPVKAETVGDTERIIGSWLKRRGRRDDVVIATKITGRGQTVRPGQAVDAAAVREAVDASLARLRTDVIDLYQIHWPNRGSYHFRRNWSYDPTGQEGAAVIQNIDEVSETMRALVETGKVRAFGLSNETSWGLMQWIASAERTGGPRPVSTQNEYSLLCRHFDTDLAETCHNENITLLAYSPLAAGLLSGKYQGGRVPQGSRMSRTPDLGGRRTDRAFSAVAAYLDVAERHGLDPCQMALAWVRSRPVPTIPIVGATTPDQLEIALTSREVEMTERLREDLEAVHRAHPMPY